jgi:sulfite exporter TauE/SafE
MVAALLQGWVLGLSSGAYCLGVCAAVMLPYLVSSGPSGWRVSGRAVLGLQAGRLAAYLLVGLAAGALGARLQGWPGLRIGAGLAMVALALLLIAHGVGRSFPEKRTCAALCGRRRVPLAAGFALGLSPCPPMLLGLCSLAETGGVVHAVVFVLALYAGSTLWLLPLPAAGWLGRRERLRGMAEIAVLASGLWFLARGVALLAAGGGG